MELANSDIGLAVLHFSTGLFFTISGARKLFVPAVHTKITGLFSRLGVGGKFVEWAVPAGEFLGGLGLFFGVLTTWAALGLIVIMLGAFMLNTIDEVRLKKPQGFWDWIAKCQCTAEGQLLTILTTLAIAGAGAISGDAIISAWRHS